MCFYSKNKLTTENFLRKKIGSKLLSLRVGNVLGRKLNKNKRNAHNLFFDNLFDIEGKKIRKIIVNNEFKDFISINQLNQIITSLV